MKAILIDAKNRTVEDFEYDGNWKTIAPTIGASLFTAVTGLPNGDDIYVDDEGLLTADENTGWFMFPWYPAPLCGSGLILGVNDEGETIATKSTAEFYREKVQFMNSQAVWLWKELHGHGGGFESPVRIGPDHNKEL